MEDLYRILQVDPKADPGVVRAAYRVLAQKYHPDLNPSPDAAKAMGRLNGAYEILGDPMRRREYDGARVTGMSSVTSARHDPHFAEQAAARAEAAYPTEAQQSHGTIGLLNIRTLRQSKAGKTGLWLGFCMGFLVLLMLVSDVNWESRDVAFQLITKVWVALMVFLILWGLVWSVGDLVSQVYLGRGKAGPPES
ncbi:MAG: J domain-containing protein [Chloroflexi bacterium]|nr:J domain-containing protein [Chloroflexota bacterium]